jgi:hypothetical protein
MRNFLKIAEGIDVMPLLHAVQRQPELWNNNRLRQTFDNSPHSQVDDIWLRFNDTTEFEKTGVPAVIMDEHESICYPAWFKLPQVQQLVFDLMRRVEGVRLGRVLITRLAPGKCVAPHIDSGSHAEYYERYHIILQNYPGSIFRAGAESVCMKPGECWWFQNQQEHEVINNSADDRITLIVDVRCIK